MKGGNQAMIEGSSDEEVYVSDIPLKKTLENDKSIHSYSKTCSDDDDDDNDNIDSSDEYISDISPDTELRKNALRYSVSPELDDSDILGKTVILNSNNKTTRLKKTALSDSPVNSSAPVSDQDDVNSNLTFTFDDYPLVGLRASDEILKEMVNMFESSLDQDNTTLITFPKIRQSKQIQKYCNILNDANIEFTTDLPLHLYSVYLLKTRNLNLPDPEFTLWPLPTNELIAPRSYLKTTTFETLGENANDLPNLIKKSKYNSINYKENNKLSKCSNHMLEFWHPTINPLNDLNECIDSIFERKINSQISSYSNSKSKKLNKYGSLLNIKFQRHTPEDINVNALLKSKIIDKLDNLIDKLVEIHDDNKSGTKGIMKKMKKINDHSTLKVPNYGLDWLSVLSCLDKDDKQSKLLLMILFNLKLDNDKFSGPIENYSADFELFAKAKLHRDKTLKKLISKKKTNFTNSRIDPNYHKVVKKQKSNVRYNLDSFFNLDLTMNEKGNIDKNGNGNNKNNGN